MKHLLLLIALLFQISAATAQTAAPARNKQTTTHTVTKKQAAPKVYICVGGSAYAYHSSDNCSGLNRCTHTVSAVSVSEAENSYNRRPCKKCY